MNRFEKKCFIGSAMLHGLLLIIVLFGSAFFTSKKFVDAGPILDFGNLPAPAPKGNPQAPVQPSPPPATEKIETPVRPEPPKEIERPKPKEVKPDLPKETLKDKDTLPIKTAERKEKETKPKPSISTTPVKRSNVVDKAAMQLAQARREREQKEQQRAEREAQMRRNEVLNEINGVINGVGKGLSHSTVVTSSGIDTSGGAVSGRYGDGLKSIYDARWVLTSDTYDDETSAAVSVMVRRDGTVTSAKITKPSGNRSFDRSVRAVLDAVHSVQPFPAEMKDAEREFSWRFERKTRLG